MDWFTLMWGPVWFVIDIIILAAEFYYFYKWIHSGIVETRDAVIGEFCSPVTAAKVRVALDMPDKADLKALESKIVPMGEVEANLKAHIDHAIESRGSASVAQLPDMDQWADNLLERLQKAGGASKIGAAAAADGLLGAAAKADKREKEKFLADFAATAGAAKDAQLIYTNLIKLGVPPGLAQYAAMGGPSAVRWVVEEILGPKKAAALIGAWDKGRAMPSQGPGGYQ